jgi:hypothetical protein
MTARETELDMATRHVTEQEKRIVRQEILIEHLQEVRVPTGDALGLLGIMLDFLETMRDHVKRISN